MEHQFMHGEMVLNKTKYISNEEKFLYGFFLGLLIGLSLSSVFRIVKQDYFIAILNGIIIVCILAIVYTYERAKNYDFAVLSMFWITTVGIFIYIVYFDYTIHIFLAILIPLAGSMLLNSRDFMRHGVAFLLLFSVLMGYGFAHKERYVYLNDSNFVIGFVLLFFFLVAFSYVYHKSIKQSYLQLQKADQQKKILLNEIHHRVKNNLNIMISILGLQEEKYTSKEIHTFIKQNKLRIKSIALVHELLYQNSDFDSINVQTYISNLTQHILSSSKKHDITLSTNVSDVELDISDIIYIGIIINELITNTIKYAYPSDAGEIEVCLKRVDDLYEFRYKDYGKGISETDKSMEGFGLSLIHLCVAQLEGQIDIQTQEGYSACVVFRGTQV